MAKGRNRTTLLTIVNILGFLQGIGLVITGLGMSIAGLLGGEILEMLVSSLGVGFGMIGDLVGAQIAIGGAIVLILGLILLLGFYWAWKFKKNGFFIALVLEIITLLGGLSILVAAFDATSLVGFLLPLIIVVGLWKNKGSFK